MDDILLLGNNFALVDNLMGQLSSEFIIRELGKLRFFFGNEVMPDDDVVVLSQR